jgi:hypothetical protein
MLISRAEAISQRRRPQNGLPSRALKNKARDQTINARLDPIAGQSIQCGRHRKTAILYSPAKFGMGARSGGRERGLTFAQLIATNAMNEGTPTASPRWCSQPINLTEKSHSSRQAASSVSASQRNALMAKKRKPQRRGLSLRAKLRQNPSVGIASVLARKGTRRMSISLRVIAVLALLSGATTTLASTASAADYAIDGGHHVYHHAHGRYWFPYPSVGLVAGVRGATPLTVPFFAGGWLPGPTYYVPSPGFCCLSANEPVVSVRY